MLRLIEEIRKNIQTTLKNNVCHNREFQGTKDNFWLET